MKIGIVEMISYKSSLQKQTLLSCISCLTMQRSFLWRTCLCCRLEKIKIITDFFWWVGAILSVACIFIFQCRWENFSSAKAESDTKLPEFCFLLAAWLSHSLNILFILYLSFIETSGIMNKKSGSNLNANWACLYKAILWHTSMITSWRLELKLCAA